MGGIENMPDAPNLGLTQARCRNNKCNSLLARVRLSTDSIVEIKCRRCGQVNTFGPDQVDGDNAALNLVPDGQGGFGPPTTIE